ncbi:MAG: succinylglutamate desuccinylase/aspartoacylase family protein [Chloroflexi bacterium]|nr:succinylglutamate desuccinylase/aspartoacylase family protein [Chloroflexota bacterium]
MAANEIIWSNGPATEKIIFRSVHHSGEAVEIPVACVTGASAGPTMAVISGMHAGEYAGVLAAQRLIHTVRPAELRGRLIVIPVVSTRAFMMRYMQLSPVDDMEAHFCVPGNPGGSYTEFLIDCLFSIVREANYLIDMHSGEFAQALYPWVPVPMIGPAELQRTSHSLALGFRVPYIELRTAKESIPPMSIALLEAGVANIWVECGKNGIPTPVHVAIHYDGAIAALQTVGMLPGEPARPQQRTLRGRRYQISASRSGVWHPAVKEGEIVEEGQFLGELTDYFGDTIERYVAPRRSLVLYYWTSPAINAERRPHGYDWHSGLVSLISLEGDER